MYQFTWNFRWKKHFATNSLTGHTANLQCCNAIHITEKAARSKAIRSNSKIMYHTKIYLYTHIAIPAG